MEFVTLKKVKLHYKYDDVNVFFIKVQRTQSGFNS